MPEETALDKKLAGLPTWGWIALAASGGIVLFAWWNARKKGSAPETKPNPEYDMQLAAGALATDQYETLLGGQRSLLSLVGNLQGKPSTPTAPPAGLTGLHVTGTTDSSISCAWDAYPGALTYEWAERSPYGATTVPVPGTLTSYTERGLAAKGTDHQITVTPITAGGRKKGMTVVGHTTGDSQGGKGLFTPPQFPWYTGVPNTRPA